MHPFLTATLAAALGHAVPIPPPPRRFAPDSAWEYRWIAGRDPEAELFIEPRHLVAVGTTLVVLDAGTRDVHLLDAATGRVGRRLQARGTGPGEFKRPSLLLGTRDGFAILDQATARLTAFTLEGQLAWDTPVADAARLAGACIADGGQVLLSYRRPESPLVLADTAGRVATAGASLAWRTKRPAGADLAYEHQVSPAGRDGRCALVPLFGGEWALVSPMGRAAAVHPLIEAGDLPRIRQTRRILERTATHLIVEGADITSTPPVAAGAMRRGDTVLVVATPLRSPGRRVIDYYEASTGRYLHSRRLPALFSAVALGPDGTFYGAHIGERTQVVVALRPVTRVRPTSRREGRRVPPRPSPRGPAPASR